MMTTSKASSQLQAADLAPAGPTTPAAWYALLGQTVTCSDGQFLLVAVTSDGLLTLQPVTP